MIRVVIIASSPVAEAGLEALVRANPEFQLAGSYSFESAEVEEAVTESRADVIVAQIEADDDANASFILDEAANGSAVVLVVHGSRADRLASLRQGLRAVLPGNATAAQLTAAIEAAAAGLGVFSPGDLDAISESSVDGDLQDAASSDAPTIESLAESLTSREIEVLRLLAEGLGNKQIASRLSISEHTAKFHVASIMGKLAAESRTEAVTIGLRRGLVLL